MKKYSKKNKAKGITLIALVVTIILLLILVGTTLSMLIGENGIIEKANIARQMTNATSEKEAISLFIQLKNMDNKEQDYIGTQLYDRTFENGNKWNIFVDTKNSKKYGSDWYYIEPKTQIENIGQTQYGWLINYETNDIIQVDSDFVNLSYENSLAIKDNLIFNFDASNVSEDMANLGKNVTLRYYDKNIYDTLEKREKASANYDRNISNDINEYVDTKNKIFKFNGNNYIEIYNENGIDTSNGFTFEFYGNLKGGVHAISDEFPYIGLMGFWDGIIENNNEIIRFGYMSNNPNNNLSNHLIYNLISWQSSNYGSWGEEGWPCNQIYPFTDFLGKDVYLTISFSKKDDGNVKQSIYVDGKLLAEGWLTRRIL